MAKRKPKQSAKRQGDADAHLRKTGVPVNSTEPVMPDWFDGEAKKEWVRLETDMRSRGCWSATFQPALVIWCTEYSAYIVAARMIMQIPKETIDDELFVRLLTCPAWKMQAEGVKKLRLLAKELGVTPASCTNLIAAPTTDAKTKERKTTGFLKDAGDGGIVGIVG